ncbi:hypothetical protein G7Y79_00037g074240 [Physcia stellaris]|nr:hypothetical protein G7Y79_00037g074240 [Physcia stellaris]
MRSSRFDGVSENGLRFLVLFDMERPNVSQLPLREWLKTVWACFEGQAKKWIDSDKEIKVILHKELPDEDDKKAFKKLICKKYPIGKPAVNESAVMEPVVAEQPVAIKPIDMQQGQDETIKQYYQRIHDALVETGRKGNLLSVVVLRNWIDGLSNKKLARHMASRPMREQSLYDVCITAERKLRQKVERNQKKLQVALQQQLQDIVDREVARTQNSYESLHFLEQIRSEVPETCTAVDITNTEIPARSTASEYAKWIIASTSLQKPSPEACLDDESPPILEEMPCNLPEINAAAVDSSDIEATDEVLASGPGKWIAAAAGKEVFDSTSTFAGPPKNPPALHIGKDIEAVALDKACAESVVDMEALNQEVFALAAKYRAFSKNPPASSTEDMEISVAMDMPSLKHLMDMNGPAIEAFDSGTAMGAPLKNPSIQQTEDPETLEKDSAHIPYELPALPAFDLSIDIDFQTYTTDIETPSFGWSRCCTIPIGPRTSSVSTCTSAPDVATTVDTEFYEGEQSFCFLDSSVSSAVDDTVDAVTAIVVDTDALTLTAGLVNTTMNSAWISLLGPVDLAPKPKHKGLPKVKIKR